MSRAKPESQVSTPVRDAAPPRVPRATLAALAASALLLAAGAALLWRAPLGFDEARYYEPAIHFFAERLPAVPLDYPAPAPPLGFLLQGIVFRLTGSLAAVRALCTLAACGTLFVLARWLGERPRAPWVVLSFATFPPMIAYAFSLKQHWITLLFLVCGLLAWRRERHGAAGLLRSLAASTNQLVAACALMVLLEQARRRRPLLAYTAPLLTLGAFVLAWRGFQPPSYVVGGFETAPGLGHLYWPQVLVLLLEIGVWIVPALPAWWRRAVWLVPAVPVLAWAFVRSRIMVVETAPELFFKQAVGPVLSILRQLLGTHGLSVAAVSVLAAAGAALFTFRRDEDLEDVHVYAAATGLVMLLVPFLFESYYVFFVLGAWTILARRMAESREPSLLVARLAGIAVGLAYGLTHALAPS